MKNIIIDSVVIIEVCLFFIGQLKAEKIFHHRDTESTEKSLVLLMAPTASLIK